MPWSFFESINDYLKNPGWGNFNFLAMARVNDPAKIDLINSKVKKLFNENYTNEKNENFLFPFLDTHLYGEFLNGKSVGGDIERIYLFAARAFGILLVACINFITAVNQSSQSMTGVGNWFTALNGREWRRKVRRLCSTGIAFLTVSVQAYGAAKANPVEALKYE